MECRVSIIVAVRQSPERLNALLTHLERQARGREVEIIVVDGSGTPEADIETAPFPLTRRIQSESRTLPGLRGEGIAAASGRWIAFIDQTEVPAPTWVTSLFEMLELKPEGAFGGAVSPGSSGSRANLGAYLFEYVAFMPPFDFMEWTGDLPGNNVCYPAGSLREAMSQTGSAEFWKPFIHERLSQMGVRFYLCPGLAVEHETDYESADFRSRCFHLGRCFGAMRRANASGARRAAFILGAPLGVLLLAGRNSLKILRRPQARRIASIGWLSFLAYCLSWGFGEWAGAWFGPADSCQRFCP